MSGNALAVACFFVMPIFVVAWQLKTRRVEMHEGQWALHLLVAMSLSLGVASLGRGVDSLGGAFVGIAMFICVAFWCAVAAIYVTTSFRPMGVPELTILTTILADVRGIVRWIDQTDDYVIRSQPDRVMAALAAAVPENTDDHPAPIDHMENAT